MKPEDKTELVAIGPLLPEPPPPPRFKVGDILVIDMLGKGYRQTCFIRKVYPYRHYDVATFPARGTGAPTYRGYISEERLTKWYVCMLGPEMRIG